MGEKIQTVEVLKMNQVASIIVRAKSHSAFQNAMMPNVETVARKLVVGVFHNVINCLYLYLCDGCCAEMLHISK